MTAAVISNTILASLVVAAIVGMLALSIVHDRRHNAAARVRRVRARVPVARRASPTPRLRVWS